MNRGYLTINTGGRLMDFSRPRVMGIVNVTPDSFYTGSRCSGLDEAEARVRQLVAEGADILDIGGYSTRPGAAEVSADEEMRRVAIGLEAARRVAPEVPVSVDTFRADVARKAVEGWNVEIINDVAGGTLDTRMWETVADLKVVYVLMHMRGTPETMSSLTDYDNVTANVITELSKKVYELRGLGVNDIIIDPGFGFAKTVAQNFKMLDELNEFCRMGMPVLAGMSRKRMLWETLGTDADHCGEATAVVNAIAIERGADILRVHDVKSARDTIRLMEAVCADKEYPETII